MKSSAMVLEPRLAWALWQGLQKLSDLLWDRYEEDFLGLAEEVGNSLGSTETLREGADRAKDLGEDLKIPF
jgi:hypothetical protein